RLSRQHFRIENQPPICHLTDLGSLNGTKVNGLRVEHVQLREGDVISAGDSSFVVHFRESSSGDGVPLSVCAGCGQRMLLQDGAQFGQPSLAAGSEPNLTLWLCAECQRLRLKYPETHPDYLIREFLGSGGMGDVYRAQQLSKNRSVAIKMMSANCT